MVEAFTVLIVDDEAPTRLLIEKVLATKGINSRLAENGGDALEQIANLGKPDLILLDIMMPDVDGFEVCRILREQYPASELPIIMLTGLDDSQHLLKAFQAGANDYLTKPFFSEELLVRVRSHLQLKKAFETLEENILLKAELQHRHRTVQHLQMTHRRLSRILDAIEDAVLAVNEFHEICFFNQPCEHLLGYTAHELLGKHIHTILPANELEILRSLQPHDQPQRNQRDARPNGAQRIHLQGKGSNERTVKVKSMPFELEDELLVVFILRQDEPLIMNGKHLQKPLPATVIIEELNRNRERLQLFEEHLNLITPSLKNDPKVIDGLRNIDTALEDLSRLISANKPAPGQLIAEVMNLALEYWQHCTGAGKVELARQSGLWTIYTNLDGWDRTQTLDKYLHPSTVPNRPHISKVMRTVDFVLSVCTEHSDMRNELETSLAQFQAIF